MSLQTLPEFEFKFEEMLKISSRLLESYLPPEEETVFSTSITINYPKHPMQQVKIFELPSNAKKNSYIRQMTQKQTEYINKEISISSIWIKASFIIDFCYI